jgi:pyrroloquinoline-quinone synthase
MDQKDFWTSAEAELRVYDFLSHPFYKAWTAGELSREDIGLYGWQYLHHVSAFPAYLTALHCRLPYGTTRRTILRNAWEEEALLISQADLWNQFAQAVKPAKPPGSGQVLPEIQHLIDTYREMAQSGPPPMALGAFYAYESGVHTVAQAKLTGLKRFYEFGGAACQFLELHTTKAASLQHAQVWRMLIDHAIEKNPDSALEALDGVKRGLTVLWNALDGLEAARHSLPKQ